MNHPCFALKKQKGNSLKWKENEINHHSFASPCSSSYQQLGCSRSIVHSPVGTRPTESFLRWYKKTKPALSQMSSNDSLKPLHLRTISVQISSAKNNFAPTPFVNSQSQFFARRLIGSRLIAATLSPSSQYDSQRNFMRRIQDSADSRLYRIPDSRQISD